MSLAEVSPGQWWQRLAAVAFAFGTVGAYIAWTANQLSPKFIWAGAALFLISFILSIPVLYQKWMAFAELLSVWIVRGLFSIVYLFVIPVLLVVRSLGKRGSFTPEQSGWLPKKRKAQTLEDMEQMG